MSFEIFDGWHSVAGFLVAVLFFLVYPVINGNSVAFRSVFFVGILLAACVPFLVEVSIEEQSKLLLRSGKAVHTLTFILFFYSCINREVILKTMPFFFWFTFLLTLASLFEFFLIDVLFSRKFYFLAITRPYFERWGIYDFNFTAPINYLIKFICLGLFFRDALVNKQSKQIFQYSVWVLVIFELVQVFVFKSYQSYDSVSSTVKNIFLIGGSGLLLYRIYAYPNMSLPISKNPYFWICLGLLLPALAELFLEFIFSKLYETDIAKFYGFYLPRNASQLISFTLLIVGIWQTKYLKFLPKAY